MGRKQKKQYESPRVKATYVKGQLEQLVRPHGDGVGFVGNYLIAGPG